MAHWGHRVKVLDGTTIPHYLDCMTVLQIAPLLHSLPFCLVCCALACLSDLGSGDGAHQQSPLPVPHDSAAGDLSALTRAGPRGHVQHHAACRGHSRKGQVRKGGMCWGLEYGVWTEGRKVFALPRAKPQGYVQHYPACYGHSCRA